MKDLSQAEFGRKVDWQFTDDTGDGGIDAVVSLPGERPSVEDLAAVGAASGGTDHNPAPIREIERAGDVLESPRPAADVELQVEVVLDDVDGVRLNDPASRCNRAGEARAVVARERDRAGGDEARAAVARHEERLEAAGRIRIGPHT